MKYIATAILLAIVITGATIYAQQDDEQFGIFHPDDHGRVIHADRIILTGTGMSITLDPDNGITLSDRKTGQTIILTFSDGRAIIGIRDRRAPNMPAALFSSDGNGFLQLRERGGAHVLTPGEITR